MNFQGFLRTEINRWVWLKKTEGMFLFDPIINQVILLQLSHTAQIRNFTNRASVLRKFYRIAYPVFHPLLLVRMPE